MNYKIKRGNTLKRCQDYVAIFCFQVTTKQTALEANGAKREGRPGAWGVRKLQ